MRRAMFRAYTMMAFFIVAAGMLCDAFNIPMPKPMVDMPWWANAYGAVVMLCAGVYILINGTDG